MATLAFNAANVKPAGISAMLPVSDSKGHPCVITASEIVENAAKTGGFLALTCEIIDGPDKGESGLYRLNIFNQSAKAVDIAYGQLSAVCHVTGVMDIQDSQQLHNIPFRIVVTLQKGENPEGYTEVKGVLHMDGAAPGKSNGQSQATPPAQPWQGQQATPPVTPPPVQEQAATPVNTPAAATPPWGGQQTPAAGGAPPWAQPK